MQLKRYEDRLALIQIEDCTDAAVLNRAVRDLHRQLLACGSATYKRPLYARLCADAWLLTLPKGQGRSYLDRKFPMDEPNRARRIRGALERVVGLTFNEARAMTPERYVRQLLEQGCKIANFYQPPPYVSRSYPGVALCFHKVDARTQREGFSIEGFTYRATDRGAVNIYAFDVDSNDQLGTLHLATMVGDVVTFESKNGTLNRHRQQAKLLVALDDLNKRNEVHPAASRGVVPANATREAREMRYLRKLDTLQRQITA